MFYDIIEWDNSVRTVEAERLDNDDYAIRYCDGVVHQVTESYLFEKLKAATHRFAWTHYYSGGGSSRHKLPFHHACKGKSCGRED